MDQELLLQASFIEKQSENIQKNLEIIEREIFELEQFNSSLDYLIITKEKTILSSLGKGVHLKAEIEDKKLFVEVGSGIVVRKSPEETKKIIDSQIKQLTEARAHLLSQLEISNSNLGHIINQIEMQKSAQKEKKSK